MRKQHGHIFPPGTIQRHNQAIFLKGLLCGIGATAILVMIATVARSSESCRTSADGKQDICTYQVDVNGDGTLETCQRTVDRQTKVTVFDSCLQENLLW